MSFDGNPRYFREMDLSALTRRIQNPGTAVVQAESPPFRDEINPAVGEKSNIGGFVDRKRASLVGVNEAHRPGGDRTGTAHNSPTAGGESPPRGAQPIAGDFAASAVDEY